MPAKKCPACGVSVKLGNFEPHVRKVHPAEVKSLALSQDERRSIRRLPERRRQGLRPNRSVIAVGAVLLIVLAALALGLPRLAPQTHPGAIVSHIHPYLRISVNGQPFAVPANVGIDPSLWNDHSLDEYGMQAMPEMGMGGMAPLHTHDASGQIHVESNVVRDYTLGEFFRIWGQSFDGQQLLGHPAGAGHRVWMVVDGVEQAPTYSLVFRDGMQIQLVCDSA